MSIVEFVLGSLILVSAVVTVVGCIAVKDEGKGLKAAIGGASKFMEGRRVNTNKKVNQITAAAAGILTVLVVLCNIMSSRM